MIDDREREMLDEVVGLLSYPASMDHWCDDEDCSIDNPKCGDMHVRAALAKIEAIADPEMKTLHPSRMTNLAERVYVEEWIKLNERKPAINYGFTTLEHILDPSVEILRGKRQECWPSPPRPSQRDAEVATTLIQWLGTNCGKGFVDRCERRINEESAERQDWWRHYPFIIESVKSGMAERFATRIVEDNIPAAELSGSIKKRLTGSVAIYLQALIAIFAIRMGIASAASASELMGYTGEWHTEKTQKLYDTVVAECRELFGESVGLTNV